MEIKPLEKFTIHYDSENEAYKIRHKIYCEENNFIDRSDSEMEIDRFDFYAYNAVIKNQDGLAVGVVRVIPWSAMYKLPFSRLSPETPGFADNWQWGEISRIGLTTSIKLDRRLAILAIFKAIFEISIRVDITHWAAMMPASLQLLLRREGISFFPCGPAIDYHGMRSPCTGTALAVIRNLHDKKPEIWDYITNSGKLYYDGTNADGTAKLSIARQGRRYIICNTNHLEK